MFIDEIGKEEIGWIDEQQVKYKKLKTQACLKSKNAFREQIILFFIFTSLIVHLLSVINVFSRFHCSATIISDKTKIIRFRTFTLMHSWQARNDGTAVTVM
jgi:hypothetical protein